MYEVYQADGVDAAIVKFREPLPDDSGAHPSIDPDERSLLFDSDRGAPGPMHHCLYACFREEGDS